MSCFQYATLHKLLLLEGDLEKTSVLRDFLCFQCRHFSVHLPLFLYVFSQKSFLISLLIIIVFLLMLFCFKFNFQKHMWLEIDNSENTRTSYVKTYEVINVESHLH